MLYGLLLLPLLVFLGRRDKGALVRLSVLLPILSALLAPLLLGQMAGPFRLDGVGLFYLMLTDLLFALIALFARGYFSEEEAWRFYWAGGLFLGAAHGAYLAHNLGVLWIFVEGSTLASALLVYHKGGARALEATWKYLMLGSVGIALGLIGVILVYALLSGATLDWREARALVGSANPEGLKLAFALLLVGFGTKVGLFPLQAWLPDAHAEAPGPASALLSGTLLNVAFYALLRYTALMQAAGLFPFASGLLLAFGLLSLLAAGFFLYGQKEYKRLLAYSSMEHMGLAVFALGLGLPWLALFHTLAHSLAKTLAFLGASGILALSHAKEVGRVGGLFRSLPALGVPFVLALAALGGLPPFPLFFAEFKAVEAAMRYPLLAAWYLVGLGLAFAGLLGPMTQMGFGPGRPWKAQGLDLWALWLLLAVLFLLGVRPPVEVFQALEVVLWTR
ncbi:proton-conducting transporter transmembrane domain-containing protein [Thermus caliditerrae]|uniref:proton-conducting transporter transmembrane domain-containing protein n=1 Tax=Thermus caliditerrae TaxID=1330700 RepID=UPI002277F2D5|nr:proton-conducting transporter membrane subunit [Thermus caliditerrae]